MLRITQCVSAEGAVKYFDVALCRSDYYRVFFYDLTREPLQHLIRSHFSFHL
jgi:hypothetical protein